ncbi:MAG: QueT transporter family protein [Clostridia bacterium]|nr:QueT transporter family protein [Clostridia bacterium]
MKKRTGLIVKAALFAAVYIVLTHLQNMLFPTLAWGMIQFRVSEAMCILALFTPAAIPGLTVGCLVFNLTSGAALPLDFLLGTLASLLATLCMWLTRRITVRGFPLLPLLFPAVFNGVLVGYELSVYIGGGFILNALCVAAGEAAVMFTLGLLLYYTIKGRKLDKKIF